MSLGEYGMPTLGTLGQIPILDIKSNAKGGTSDGWWNGPHKLTNMVHQGVHFIIKQNNGHLTMTRLNNGLQEFLLGASAQNRCTQSGTYHAIFISCCCSFLINMKIMWKLLDLGMCPAFWPLPQYYRHPWQYQSGWNYPITPKPMAKEYRIPRDSCNCLN